MKKRIIPLTILAAALLFLSCEQPTDDGLADLSSYLSYDPMGIYFGDDGPGDIVIVNMGYDFEEGEEPDQYIVIDFPDEAGAADGTYTVESDVFFTVVMNDFQQESSEAYYGKSGTITISGNLTRYELDSVVLEDEDESETESLTGYFSLTGLFDESESESSEL